MASDSRLWQKSHRRASGKACFLLRQTGQNVLWRMNIHDRRYTSTNEGC